MKKAIFEIQHFLGPNDGTFKDIRPQEIYEIRNVHILYKLFLKLSQQRSEVVIKLNF